MQGILKMEFRIDSESRYLCVFPTTFEEQQKLKAMFPAFSDMNVNIITCKKNAFSYMWKFFYSDVDIRFVK